MVVTNYQVQDASENPKSKYFWNSRLPLGATVQLSDIQSIEQIKKWNLLKEFLSYQVNRIRRVTDLQKFGQLLLFDLQNIDGVKDMEEQPLLLFVKMADNLPVDVRMYYPHPDFQPANRADLANSWLFEDPRNCADTPMNQLKYTDAIDIGGLEFRWRQPGEMQGTCFYVPPLSGVDKRLVVTFKEFATDDKNEENPEMLILETGAVDNEAGGLIELFQGCRYDTDNLKVFPPA